VSGLGWQDLTAAVVVALALAYLVRRRRRKAPPVQMVTLGRAPSSRRSAPRP
jgi:hypothetical protein